VVGLAAVLAAAPVLGGAEEEEALRKCGGGWVDHGPCPAGYTCVWFPDVHGYDAPGDCVRNELANSEEWQEAFRRREQRRRFLHICQELDPAVWAETLGERAAECEQLIKEAAGEDDAEAN
jgi:hypothetical protein